MSAGSADHWHPDSQRTLVSHNKSPVLTYKTVVTQMLYYREGGQAHVCERGACGEIYGWGVRVFVKQKWAQIKKSPVYNTGGLQL